MHLFWVNSTFHLQYLNRERLSKAQYTNIETWETCRTEHDKRASTRQFTTGSAIVTCFIDSISLVHVPKYRYFYKAFAKNEKITRNIPHARQDEKHVISTCAWFPWTIQYAPASCATLGSSSLPRFWPWRVQILPRRLRGFSLPNLDRSWYVISLLFSWSWSVLSPFLLHLETAVLRRW